MDRVIGHIDLDYFYAQVEEVENPSLKERPVVVCVFSGRTDDSGVVATANYKARGLGVRSGMPIVVAKRKLEGQNPVVVRMDHPKYEAISDRVMQLVSAKVDLLEQSGIDEAFFDLTKRCGGDYGKARSAGEEIKKSILEDEHLTCSVGIGRSKAVAKLCSDMAKPGGIMVVTPASTAGFMKPLEVSKLYGVGPKTAQTLDKLGIRTMGELADSEIQSLETPFGKKLAAYLHSAANGMDDEPISESQAPTQLMRVITLKQNTTDAGEAVDELSDAFNDLKTRLNAQNLSFRTMTAIAILADLSTKTRSKTFETPIDDLSAVGDDLLDLFSDLSSTVDKQFRRVGIRVSDLSSNQDQSSLSEFLQPAR